MDLIADIIIVLLVTVGIIFTIVTVIGILRLPDVYTRAHAASKSATLGVMSLLLGVFLHFWWNEGHFSVAAVARYRLLVHHFSDWRSFNDTCCLYVGCTAYRINGWG